MGKSLLRIQTEAQRKRDMAKKLRAMDRSYSEIANIMNVPKGSIGTLLYGKPKSNKKRQVIWDFSGDNLNVNS
jgi:DNA-directed RNA polymerase specialized sigma24 family protein